MQNLKPVLIPAPQSAAYGAGEILLCRDATPCFSVKTEGREQPVVAQAEALLLRRLAELGCLNEAKGALTIRLAVDPSAPALAGHAVADAYALRATPDGIELTGYDAGGVFCAAATFAQLLCARDGRISVPEAEIVDWPDFPVRGLFIEDRYGSDFLTREDWFKAIDYFASMKFNSFTVGVYGCWCQQYDGRVSEYLYVPFKGHPELQTPRNIKYYSPSRRQWVYQKDVLPVMFRDDYFGELAAYAKARNIRVKPLFNSYGHNTLIPRMFPELSAKDADGNPTGFGVCTADDRTYEIMNSLYDEIVDRYLLPNGLDSLHIGLDEVWDGIGMDNDDPFKYHTPFCQCEKCRNRSRGELMTEYIVRICKHLKTRGVKHVYLYYDMLFNKFDSLDESFAQLLKDEGIYDTVVIDWWDYSSEDKLFFGKELNSLFHSIIKPITGYYHWSTPLEYLSNIRGCARLCAKHGYDGMEAYSSLEYSHDRSYWYTAELAWNAGKIDDAPDFLRRYAALRFPEAPEEAEAALQSLGEVMADNFMGGQTKPCELFRLDYYMYTYVKADKPYPRRFPEEAFERIHEDEAYFVDYFTWVQAHARPALAFLEAQCEKGSGDRGIALSWLAIAKHFDVVAGEYLGLLALEKETDAAAAAARLDGLIAAREDLMRTVEEVRIEANVYQYLRNMTVYRQILVDLRACAGACEREGKPFALDLTRLDGVTGETLRFLR